MRRVSSVLLAAAVGAATGLGAAGAASAEQKEVVIGGMCDRTGPTQVNSKGGVEGYKIKYEEIDHEYKVPPAVEAYEREKGDGATSILVYGTPQVQALNQKLQEDKIPGTSPGFGIAASADGTRFPYLFPVAATSGEIHQLAANARRPGVARQLAQFAGHFPVVIAISQQRRLLPRGQCRHSARNKKLRAGLINPSL